MASLPSYRAPLQESLPLGHGAREILGNRKEIGGFQRHEKVLGPGKMSCHSLYTKWMNVGFLQIIATIA